MALSLRQFALKIRKTAKNIPERADQITRQVALAADRQVVLSTPVDTGRARGNWQPSLGAPAEGTLELGQARANPESTVGAYVGGRPTSVIFITNNLPYIVPLNNGSSQQAPPEFVAIAIDSALRAARRARLID
jgi:hypothetical protein